MHTPRIAALLSLLGLLSLSACKDEPRDDSFSAREKASLTRFAACEDMMDYAGTVMLETLLMYQYGGSWGWRGGGPEMADDAAGDSSSAPSDYTTTNVQEEGVDEVDLVKTDGLYIYTVQEGALHILKSWPVEETEKLATVSLDGWASGLFLNGDQLAVFESLGYDEASWSRSWSGTRVSFFDVTDRAAPHLTRTVDIEGWLVDGRMIDGDIYLVMNHYLGLPEAAWELLWGEGALPLPEVDWTLEGEALEADIAFKREIARTLLRPHVARLVSEMSPGDLLPWWSDSDVGRVTTMYDCVDLYRPADASRYNILSVVHFDLDSGESDATGVMSDGWTVYASKDNLYVAQSSWWSWWGWGDVEMQSYIHRFHLGGGEAPTYDGTGVVDGWLYDQFAMSEHDGYLRVATTDVDWWWGTAEGDEAGGSNVFVLGEGEQDLAVVGELRGIAPGEQIMAARMMGDTGYIVTFRQTDPLFTVDLSDPTDPKLLGELVMPGYSGYLHPMEEGWLLAIGMDGTEDGALTGLSVNVFDVRDLSAPKLAHQYVLPGDGWSWSEALWDHHAFTFHRGVLTIPAYAYDWDGDSEDWFSGVISFAVSPDGILELGRVDHRSLVEASECYYSKWYGYEASSCEDWGWYATVRRSVYIEDNLFSVSNYGVKVNELMDPEVEIAAVPFFPR
jgi:uncharacterized secreted protein with C-terminal beta-propeller domain